MEPQVTSLVLEYTSPAWPARLTGVSIFVAVLIIFFSSTNFPLFVLLIVFAFMIVAVFLSADTSVTADRSLKTLTITKKRVIGSTSISYPFDDIAFLLQNISNSTNQKGETVENIKFTIGLNSQTGSLPGYYQGRRPIPFPVPVNPLTMFIKTARNIQEFARAQEFASFIGVPLYINGGQNDTFVNVAQDIPRYIEGIQKLPDVFAEAKKENDRVAREILGDKYPN